MHGLSTPPISLNELFIRGIEKQNALMTRIKVISDQRGWNIQQMKPEIVAEMEEQATNQQDDPDWLIQRIEKLKPVYENLSQLLKLVCIPQISVKIKGKPARKMGASPIDWKKELQKIEHAHPSSK